MNEEESKKVYEIVSKFGKDKKLYILNIGSGTETYYTVQQPNIWNDLLFPLTCDGHILVNLDIKEGEGIDITAEVHKMPIADKEFDVVLFNSVIEHLKHEHIEESIKQIRRILKDDGIVIASAPASYPKHDVYDNGIRITEAESWEYYFDTFNWKPIEYYETKKISAKDFYKDRWDMDIMTYMTLAVFKKYEHFEVTVVCCNWKRPENIKRVVYGIIDNTIPAKILIWDNSGKMISVGIDGEVPPNRIEFITCSSNYQSMAKKVAAMVVSTPYVLFQDDDLQLHPDTIQVMLDCEKRHPNSIICLKKGVVDIDGEYTGSMYSKKEEPIMFTVGRVMLCKTELIGEIFNPDYKEILDMGEEDLCLGCAVQIKTSRPAYVVPIEKCRPLELPDHSGRCHRPWHYENRTKTIKMFLDRGFVDLRYVFGYKGEEK